MRSGDTLTQESFKSRALRTYRLDRHVVGGQAGWVLGRRGMGGTRKNDVTNRLHSLLPDEGDVISKGRDFLARFVKAERRLFAYILTLLPHRADAEDVLQEVSAIMW